MASRQRDRSCREHEPGKNVSTRAACCSIARLSCSCQKQACLASLPKHHAILTAGLSVHPANPVTPCPQSKSLKFPEAVDVAVPLTWALSNPHAVNTQLTCFLLRSSPQLQPCQLQLSFISTLKRPSFGPLQLGDFLSYMTTSTDS